MSNSSAASEVSTTIKVTKGSNGKFSAEIVQNKNALPAAQESEVAEEVAEVVNASAKAAEADANEDAAAQLASQGGRRTRRRSHKRHGGSYKKRRNGCSRRNKRHNGRSYRNRRH